MQEGGEALTCLARDCFSQRLSSPDNTVTKGHPWEQIQKKTLSTTPHGSPHFTRRHNIKQITTICSEILTMAESSKKQDRACISYLLPLEGQSKPICQSLIQKGLSHFTTKTSNFFIVNYKDQINSCKWIHARCVYLHLPFCNYYLSGSRVDILNAITLEAKGQISAFVSKVESDAQHCSTLPSTISGIGSTTPHNIPQWNVNE